MLGKTRIKLLVTLFALFLNAPLLSQASLQTSVAALEANGGTGIWFKSTLQSRFGNGPAEFYLLNRVPQVPVDSADVTLWNTKEGLRTLNQLILAGVPLVYVVLDLKAQIPAAVLPIEFQVTQDVLLGAPNHAPILRNSTHRNIMLLGPYTTLLTLRHELQHWVDREDPHFVPNLKEALASFMTREKLPPTIGGIELAQSNLIQIVLEQRGHYAQYDVAEKLARTGTFYINRAGALSTEPEDVRQGYDYEAREAVNAFWNTYLLTLSGIFNGLNRSQKAELIDLIRRFELNPVAQNPIEIGSRLGLPLPRSIR